jgi:hypothetical protein
MSIHFGHLGAAPLSSPPPLWGRDREGGVSETQRFIVTPLPNPPPQGGREPAAFAAHVRIKSWYDDGEV